MNTIDKSEEAVWNSLPASTRLKGRTVIQLGYAVHESLASTVPSLSDFRVDFTTTFAEVFFVGLENLRNGYVSLQSRRIGERTETRSFQADQYCRGKGKFPSTGCSSSTLLTVGFLP